MLTLASSLNLVEEVSQAGLLLTYLLLGVRNLKGEARNFETQPQHKREEKAERGLEEREVSRSNKNVLVS